MKHWSKVEYLHETVRNSNIHIKGKHSYYSNAWTDSFEQDVVRYLYGDEYSVQAWKPVWEIDQLYIGDYVCIGAQSVILMGGNNTHRTDWFSCYPFMDKITDMYRQKGDTVIGDGAWIGMKSFVLAGIHIGEGAVVASMSVVTKDVAPYTVVAGNPAKEVKKRFPDDVIKRLLNLKIYDLPERTFNELREYLCNNDIDSLEQALRKYSKE